MPKGLTPSSSVVAIGFEATQTAANTFIQEQVDLNMSPLDREVFVVLSINLDPSSPEAIAATDTSVECSLTATSQSDVANLSNSNCLATARNDIRAKGFIDSGVSFSRAGFETPPTNLDYIGIIATNDFFIQVEGAGNTKAKGANVRVWGYRTRADATVYAALVQSEVLSA